MDGSSVYYVKLKDDEKAISLKAENGRLKLSTVKIFFSKARGLTFDLNGNPTGVGLEKDELILEPGVKEYAVFYDQPVVKGKYIYLYNYKKIKKL